MHIHVTGYSDAYEKIITLKKKPVLDFTKSVKLIVSSERVIGVHPTMLKDFTLETFGDIDSWIKILNCPYIIPQTFPYYPDSKTRT